MPTTFFWGSFWQLTPPHTACFRDIIIQWTSHDDLTEKNCFTKIANEMMMVKKKLLNGILWFDEKTAFVEFCQQVCLTQIFKSIWGSNPWMNLLEKKITLYQFLFYFLQIKLLLLWMASLSHNLDKFWFVCWDKV